jgi:CheY-like chemotaxis protein
MGAMNESRPPILVVEDVPNVLELLEITLRFQGYPVITARNGQEALDVIGRQIPALVITDILMPKMDGYALAHALRRQEHTRALPIIFLSATYVTEEDKRFAYLLGAVRFLEKPIDTEDFLLTVAETLNGNASATRSEPISESAFYAGYRERLEQKLRYKNGQIARTERLLRTLPDEQRPAFESLLLQASGDRQEIQRELDNLHSLLDQTTLPEPAADSI